MTKIFSCTFSGLDCQIIEVEADISNGLPKFHIVGLGDASVQEAKERVRASIRNAGAEFPYKRKVVNLAPAEIRKQGTHFDLAIAISLLLASDQIPAQFFEKAILIGELSLTGKVKPVHGILPLTQYAKSQGFKRIFLPESNALEASYIKDIEIFPVVKFKDLINYSRGDTKMEVFKNANQINLEKISEENNFEGFLNIVGLEKAKRALIIAATGGHNVFLEGSPGCGKTILARAFRDLLPSMTTSEMLETTKIFSVSGQLDLEKPIIKERPFREVHHTASVASVIGGGIRSPKPGEISLAHNGVLFFDEISEFPRKILESLRQPLEDKYININRSRFYSRFPSNFLFIATTNPCPCGYYNDSKVNCTCTLGHINQYQKRLSGPILDRFDIFLEIPRIPIHQAMKNPQTDGLRQFIDKIEKVRKKQYQRFSDYKGIRQNSDMQLKHIKEFCEMEKSAEILLEKANKKLNLSNRAYLKTLKVARTIADLDGRELIGDGHVAEAVQYRRR
ncbi:YifB family Mg chelatase-like AAA ATPase [Patescibacteria group bacterium]